MSDSEGSGSTPAAQPRRRVKTSLLARGESMLWITGGSLVLGVVMIIGLLLLVVYLGMGTFWPRELQRVSLEPMAEGARSRFADRKRAASAAVLMMKVA